MSRANLRPTGLTRKTRAWALGLKPRGRYANGNNCSLAMVSPSAHAFVRKRIIVTQPGSVAGAAGQEYPNDEFSKYPDRRRPYRG